MADIVFTIPSNRAELLSEIQSNYTVRNVVIPGEIVGKLEEAQASLREEGPNFILENFDTYYSILHHGDKLRPDVVHKAYSHLLKAVKELDDSILFLLDDKDSLNQELKAKTVNIMKMLIYIYIQFVMYFEEKKKKEQDDNIGGKGKNKEKKGDNFSVNKTQVLNSLNSIIQREINSFWEPPIVEHDFVGMIAELCFALLQNPSIKQEKTVIMEIFGVFGNLVKSYDYGKNFVTRLVQSIRMYEHLSLNVAEGIKMIVQQFGCQTLVHYFVKEATEWQVDETYQDAQGTRCCSVFLTELALTMPDLMLPEVMYLGKYLSLEYVPLRVAVLNVMNEIVLNVLTKHDLTEEEKETRDEILEVIVEHVRDFSAVVRSKVIQNLSKLQKECALPLTFQNEVLNEFVKHLYDKAAAARKNAINGVTTFLEHNPFGANLQLKKAEEQLAEKKEMLTKMEATYKEAQLAKIEELEAEWSGIENELKEVVQKQLDKADDEDLEEDLPEINPTDVVDKIREFLKEKKFVEAFSLCRRFKDSIEELKNMRKLSEEEEVEGYMKILHSFFINTIKIIDELRTGAGMTDEDIKKMKSLENVIGFLENTTSFLKIIDSAMKPMKSLLFSTTMSDVHEAIQFFVTAYQFQIDNASDGILEMLKVMRCNEQERKTAIVDAFKSVYLVTDTRNMKEHTQTILKRLFGLLREVTYDNLEDFESIITEWTAKGILDNSVIDRCWQYYTQRESVTDDDARAACEILRMAAMGRYSIITKNISVVTKIAFSEQHKHDLMFLASSCRLLAVAGLEKIDVQSEKPPFRVKYSDPIFQDLANMLIEEFFGKNPFYYEAVQAGLLFIYRVSSNPLEIVQKIIQQIDEKLREQPKCVLFFIRWFEVLGCVAKNTLSYLDNSVYRELKRRQYLREEREKEKKTKKKGRKSATVNRSLLDASSRNNNETSSNDSVLMGAEAEDGDAEFILSVLENDVVTSKGVLGKYASMIVNVCQRPDLYTDGMLRHAAVTALIRYMLVSSTFCRNHIQLLFTILEKTVFPEIKCTILIHFSDLVIRFPNIAEPWSDRVYKMLKDSLVEVRKRALYSLASLILRAMIRAHSHTFEIAVCLIDPDPEVSEMTRNFFERYEQKDHSLVNVIPDIFTHLVQIEEIDQESLRHIMKFLFDLIDNSKRIENLVDRFCCKYSPDDNMRLNRNVTYCLSLINYNDKSLKKLREKFPTYQHHVHDAEIYSTFKQILTECSKNKPGKPDLKPIVTEIEACIASVFEVTEDGQPAKPPPVLKSTKKGRGNSKRRRGKAQVSDSDDDDEDEPRSRSRGRKGRKQPSDSEDSDERPSNRRRGARKGGRKQMDSGDSDEEPRNRGRQRSGRKSSSSS